MEEPGSCNLRDCSRCPRLVERREAVRIRHPDYFAAPVPAWGLARARMLIVGLAPGMHGANRTGRPFTGDASGDFLFRALYQAGFASAPEAAAARLDGVRITNAVKCLPPDNRPVAAEIRNCRPFLKEEIASLRGLRPRRPRVLLCLGRVAHEAVLDALRDSTEQTQAPPLPGFRHGLIVAVAKHFYLLDTYHPSRLNTNTGRLTAIMLDEVMASARRILETAG